MYTVTEKNDHTDFKNHLPSSKAPSRHFFALLSPDSFVSESLQCSYYRTSIHNGLPTRLSEKVTSTQIRKKMRILSVFYPKKSQLTRAWSWPVPDRVASQMS